MTDQKLIDIFPDDEVLCALEPDELGLRMLPVLAKWRGPFSIVARVKPGLHPGYGAILAPMDTYVSVFYS